MGESHIIDLGLKCPLNAEDCVCTENVGVNPASWAPSQTSSPELAWWLVWGRKLSVLPHLSSNSLPHLSISRPVREADTEEDPRRALSTQPADGRGLPLAPQLQGPPGTPDALTPHRPGHAAGPPWRELGKHDKSCLMATFPTVRAHGLSLVAWKVWAGGGDLTSGQILPALRCLACLPHHRAVFKKTACFRGVTATLVCIRPHPQALILPHRPPPRPGHWRLPEGCVSAAAGWGLCRHRRNARPGLSPVTHLCARQAAVEVGRGAGVLGTVSAPAA